MISERLAITGRIARSIAHEVRNPLTNLRLALDQLDEEISGNEEADMLSGIIGRNAERIDQLINELLESSKSQSLEIVDQPIKPVIDEAIKLVRDRIMLKGMVCEVDVAGNLPDLKIHRDSLTTAILNILVNAVEAMEEDKGRLRVGVFEQDKHVLININDNGKGIPAEELSRLFDPFFYPKKIRNRSGTYFGAHNNSESQREN